MILSAKRTLKLIQSKIDKFNELTIGMPLELNSLKELHEYNQWCRMARENQFTYELVIDSKRFKEVTQYYVSITTYGYLRSQSYKYWEIRKRNDVVLISYIPNNLRYKKGQFHCDTSYCNGLSVSDPPYIKPEGKKRSEESISSTLQVKNS